MTQVASDRRVKANKLGPRTTRVLVHIPVVHSQADLGSYAARARRAYLGQKGAKAWLESRRAIDEVWNDLEKRISSLDLKGCRLRLYQDALPVCGREIDIVRDLAASGMANYRILLELMERGAVLEGTESPELLLRERDLLNTDKGAAGSAGSPKSGEARREAAAELLRLRDRFIAGRIDETLRSGETGMLFIGALHHVADFLPPAIKIMDLEEFTAEPSRF